jgi:hypothetical protein
MIEKLEVLWIRYLCTWNVEMRPWKSKKEKKEKSDQLLSKLNDSFPLTGFFCNRVLDKLESMQYVMFLNIFNKLRYDKD